MTEKKTTASSRIEQQTTCGRPSVTVVVPCYNAEKWVGRAIRSALNQEGVHVEVIVIDDGSTDGSLKIARGFGDRIRCESGPNRGACAARNRGLALATSAFVMFLDADDYIEGRLLVEGLSAMSEAEADMAFGQTIVEYLGQRKTYQPPRCYDYKELAHFFLTKYFIGPSATIWRAQFVREIGGWRKDLSKNQDFEIVFRAIARRPKIGVWHKGAGVWSNHTSATRISCQMSDKVFQDQILVLLLCKTYLLQAGFNKAEATALLLPSAYDLWRLAARSGSRKAEREVRRAWLRFGGLRHSGGLLHRMTVAVLGMRGKERIAGMFRNLGVADHSGK